MLKFVPSDSYSFDEPIVEAVKVSSRGLRGNDLSGFLKRASHSFVDALDHIPLHEGERPVHVLAFGATERFGCNRKGDGFEEEVCRKYHPTFHKFARYYRDHASKDPLKNYGRVLADCFNEDMKRVELLVALNGNEKAASANSGLVADIEQELLDSGVGFSTSMGCKVPWDQCSGCHHRAITTDDYCHGSMCKYGGLKTNIGKTFEDGHQLHARNLEPLFHDISGVFRGADRTSYALDYLSKTASVDSTLEEPPAWYFVENVSDVVARQRDILRSLAAMEQTLPLSWAGDAAMTKRASIPGVPFAATAQGRRDVWTALAENRNHLPLSNWLQVACGDSPEVAARAKSAQAALPGIYSRLSQDPRILEKLTANIYTAADRVPSPTLRNWSTKLAADFSLDAPLVRQRAQRAVIFGSVPSFQQELNRLKTASVTADDRAIAEQYALYTLGFLESTRRSGDPDPAATCTFVLRRSVLN